MGIILLSHSRCLKSSNHNINNQLTYMYILDGHGCRLTPRFNRIRNIMPLCIPAHSSHLLQALNIGHSAVLKRAYCRFLSALARVGRNYIENLDFLADYPWARTETCQ